MNLVKNAARYFYYSYTKFSVASTPKVTLAFNSSRMMQKHDLGLWNIARRSTFGGHSNTVSIIQQETIVFIKKTKTARL